MKVIYVAGPMRGLPQFNFPLFDAVSAALRAQGHQVISPAEQDSPAIRAAALLSTTGVMTPEMERDESVGTILGRDVRLVIDDATDIALLPGWQKSSGARLEVCVGLLNHKGFYVVHHTTNMSDDYTITAVHRENVRDAFLEAMQ